MSVLYLHFAGPERDARVQKLAKSGAHVLVSEPHWPRFFELAKKERPYAIAIDFSKAPSHALETADYLAKAKETREAAIYVLRVPTDRLDILKKRLPKALSVSEEELSERLAEAEREAQARALEKKEAASMARKAARAKKAEAEKPLSPSPPKAPATAKKPDPAMKPKGEKPAASKKKAPVKKRAARASRKKKK